MSKKKRDALKERDDYEHKMAYFSDEVPETEKKIDDLITFEQLSNAFIDVLDGWGFKWQEIQAQTGLSESRCKDIVNIFNKLSK